MTSPPEQITVECPNCGNVYEDWHQASINAELDPGPASDPQYLLDASTATCPTCGHRVDLDFLLVEDDVWTFSRPDANPLSEPPHHRRPQQP